MSQTWQAPFHVLCDQFLAASHNNFRVNLALASFPSHDSYRFRYDQTIDAELRREANSFMNQEPGQRTQERAIGTVWGKSEGVLRFNALAREAGNALPFDFYPAHRLLPWFNESSNVNPNPVTIWSEFLFVTRVTVFEIQEDHATRGGRIASDPFWHPQKRSNSSCSYPRPRTSTIIFCACARRARGSPTAPEASR